MLLSSINKNPGRKELLAFTVALALIFGVIGHGFHARRHLPQVALVVWSLGACFILLMAFVPPLRRPLYVGYRYAVFPIGWTVFRVMLAVLFFLVLTPVGLICRLFGRDPLQRRIDRSASSYWVERGPPPPLDRYFRPY